MFLPEGRIQEQQQLLLLLPFQSEVPKPQKEKFEISVNGIRQNNTVMSEHERTSNNTVNRRLTERDITNQTVQARNAIENTEAAPASKQRRRNDAH